MRRKFEPVDDDLLAFALSSHWPLAAFQKPSAPVTKQTTLEYLLSKHLTPWEAEAKRLPCGIERAARDQKLTWFLQRVFAEALPLLGTVSAAVNKALSDSTSLPGIFHCTGKSRLTESHTVTAITSH